MFLQTTPPNSRAPSISKYKTVRLVFIQPRDSLSNKAVASSKPSSEQVFEVKTFIRKQLLITEQR